MERQDRNISLPENERERLETLINFNILDNMPESDLDTITQIATQIARVPIALISITDGKTRYIKSSTGLNVYELQAEFEFLGEIAAHRDFLQVPDAILHNSMRMDPLVIGHPYFRFMAGTPLITTEGYVIGTICVIDQKPGNLNKDQADSLKNLGKQVIRMLEVRKQNKNLQSELNQLLHDRINQTEIDLAAYKFALDQSSGVAISDRNGYFKFVNDRFCAASGYQKEELLGRPFSILNSGHHNSLFFGNLWSIITEGKIWHGEIRNQNKEGDYYWVDCNIIPFLDKKGKPYQYMAIQQDITEKKHAQERMSLETRMSSILSQNYSIEATIQHIIEQICFRLEWDIGVYLEPERSNSLISNLYYQITYPHIEPLKTHLNNRKISQGKGMAGRAWERKTPLWITDISRENDDSDTSLTLQHGIHSTLLLPVIFNGEVLGIMQFFSFAFKKNDLNVLQMFEGTGLQIGAFIQRKISEKELIMAKQQAEESVISKDLFLTNMSHEIRTPMNAIIGFTELLNQTDMNDRQREYAESVKIAGENLLAIINDILDFSKIESGIVNIESISSDIQQILKNVYNLLRISARQKSLDFSYGFDNGIPEMMMCDPLRLNQILINLVGNAIKFTEKGSVRFEARLMRSEGSRHQLLFSVKDTGIGIQTEKRDKIFERFTQVNNEINRKYEGTGLGLSISKSLIELMGGKLDMYSVPGQGSEFWFTLWLETGIKTESELTEEDENASLLAGKRKILLIEDNLLNQKLALSVLEEYGYHVDVASNGQTGLDRLQKNDYDLILMDLQMPELDGYQSTKIIREKLGMKTPIIAMTAHSIVGEKEKCLSSGMNDFISKPFNADELNNKIVRQLTGKIQHPARTAAMKPVHEDGPENLKYLRELSNGNLSFENELIRLFIHQVPLDIENIVRELESGNYDSVRKLCHKLKSSFDIFGRNDLTKSLNEISAEAESNADIGSLLHKTEQIRQNLNHFYPVLEKYLQSIQIN